MKGLVGRTRAVGGSTTLAICAASMPSLHDSKQTKQLACTISPEAGLPSQTSPSNLKCYTYTSWLKRKDPSLASTWPQTSHGPLTPLLQQLSPLINGAARWKHASALLSSAVHSCASRAVVVDYQLGIGAMIAINRVAQPVTTCAFVPPAMQEHVLLAVVTLGSLLLSKKTQCAEAEDPWIWAPEVGTAGPSPSVGVALCKHFF